MQSNIEICYNLEIFSNKAQIIDNNSKKDKKLINQ